MMMSVLLNIAIGTPALAIYYHSGGHVKKLAIPAYSVSKSLEFDSLERVEKVGAGLLVRKSSNSNKFDIIYEDNRLTNSTVAKKVRQMCCEDDIVSFSSSRDKLAILRLFGMNDSDRKLEVLSEDGNRKIFESSIGIVLAEHGILESVDYFGESKVFLNSSADQLAVSVVTDKTRSVYTLVLSNFERNVTSAILKGYCAGWFENQLVTYTSSDWTIGKKKYAGKFHSFDSLGSFGILFARVEDMNTVRLYQIMSGGKLEEVQIHGDPQFPRYPAAFFILRDSASF